MTGIIDRYVTRSFLHSYLVALGVLVGLYLVIDISSNLSEFIKQTTLSGLFPLTARVYVTQLPLLFKELSPATLLVGAAFTLTELTRNNELLPIKAAGTSIFRVLRPIFLLAIFLTLLTVLDQEVLIPALAEPISWGEAVTRAESTSELKDVCLVDSFDNIFLARVYRSDKAEMEDLHLLARHENRKKKFEVLGARARWRQDRQGISGWELLGGRLVTYDAEEKRLAAETTPPEGYFIEYSETSPGKDFQITTDLLPRDFQNAGRELHLHSLPDLRHRLRRTPGDVFLNVELQRRYAFPLSNLILLMIGVPLVLRSEMKNRFLGAGLAILLFAAYYGLAFFCVELGSEGTIAPAAAVWLPVLVFGPLGLFLLDGIRT